MIRSPTYKANIAIVMYVKTIYYKKDSEEITENDPNDNNVVQWWA